MWRSKPASENSLSIHFMSRLQHRLPKGEPARVQVCIVPPCSRVAHSTHSTRNKKSKAMYKRSSRVCACRDVHVHE